jgi:CubicO group peptidase (beta-lactamase class C family)
MDSALLAVAIDRLLEQRDLYNIHSLTIVRKGYLVADVYFYPFQPGELHNLSSTGKVFTSAVVGLAIDKGYIASVDEKVIDFFPERTIAHLDDRKRAMTIEHLLTMTSGLGGVVDYSTEVEELEASDDWVQYALDLPMTQQPGTVYRYSNPNAFLLSAIITQATGMSARDFAQKNMLGPLGIIDTYWKASPNGHSDGTGGLKLTPDAQARFGQLFLQQGTWNGQQILSEHWVTTSTSLHVDDFYCYIWNRYPDFDSFVQGGGSGGQRLIVAAPYDMVVVFTGGGYAHEDIERIYLDTLRNYIFAAVQSDEALPPNPAGTAQLTAAIGQAASYVADPVPVAPLPDMAHQVSGRTYVMDVPAGSLNLVLSFPADDEARLSFIATPEVLRVPSFELAAGLDGVYRYARGPFGMLAVGTGGWQNERTFVMDVDLVGGLALLRATFELVADNLTFTLESLDQYEPFSIVFTGVAQQ